MEKELTSKLRDFNRFYTNILGVVNNHILESNYSLIEARIIYETGRQKVITAREIMERLQMDEGYLSRIVAKFVKQDVLLKEQSKKDKRVFTIGLTNKGRQVLSNIDLQSDKQVEGLISHLSPKDREKLVELLVEAKQLLTKSDAQNDLPIANIDFKIAETDHDFEEARNLFKEYAASLDFDLGFQDFKKELETINKQYHAPKGALLLCFDKEKNVIGCAGVRELSEGIAELKRLYVKPEFRSFKIGKKLLTIAIETAKKMGYHYIRLDTVPGQEKAQGLYYHLGFYKIESYRYSPIDGTIFMEKKFF
jgi:DNA-binding MarR family transcriptional regulator/N-acetylglutamate synthase-like GNAT family acetyltransferase